MSHNVRYTVDLSAIAANWRMLSDMIAPAECAAVVKADAYGLGMAVVARALWQAGCRSYFVAYVEEGRTLRGILPEGDIYVLGGIPPGDELLFSEIGLTPVVNTLDELARMKETSKAHPIPLALNVDTGIHRLGLQEADLKILQQRRDLLAGVEIKLIMSQLVTPETHSHPLNKRQRERFGRALGILPSVRTSLSASAGLFLGSSFHFDMLRPGAALFGVNTSSSPENPMRNVLTLEARVLQVHEVQAGETVGYGAMYLVEKPTRIATLSMGYADGLPRNLGNRGHAIIAGRKVPFVGRVSMDVLTVDVTTLGPEDVQPGMWAELIGPNRPLDEVADEAETVTYEILTGLASRSPRTYITSG